jgi:hypothetical protein
MKTAFVSVEGGRLQVYVEEDESPRRSFGADEEFALAAYLNGLEISSLTCSSTVDSPANAMFARMVQRWSEMRTQLYAPPPESERTAAREARKLWVSHYKGTSR